jgi:hypothetical protein
MQFEQALESVTASVVPADFGRFRDHIDPLWIEEALWATGTASQEILRASKSFSEDG